MAKPAAARTFDRAAMKHAIDNLHGIYTPYPRLNDIKAGIIDLIERDNRSSQGVIHALIGPTRSGKSHLLDDLMLGYPRRENAIQVGDGDFCDHLPVVVSRVPSNSVKTVAEYIYESIAGRHPDQVLGSRYKQSKVVSEIIRLAWECRLKLLILDEAHQSIDQKTDKVAFDVAVLVKDLVNAKLFSVLIVGTENAMRLVRANAEVEARTTCIHRLEPFGRSADDRQDWKDILGDIDGDLAEKVFNASSDLTAPDMAEALLTGAQGIVGHMASLIEGAATKAMDDMIAGDRNPGIKWHHLEAVFASWAPGNGHVNPFSENARAPCVLEPCITGASDTPHEGPASGVRGRTRATRRDTQLRK